MSKHKHHDLICQWAADTSRKVEWSQNGGRTWHALSSVPLWDESVEYRFADSVLRCRVALFEDGSMSVANTNHDAECVEADAYFVRWITDWIEVTEKPVEPPKPRLKHEVWLTLTPIGHCIVFDDEVNASAYATRHSSEVRHIEWEVPA